MEDATAVVVVVVVDVLVAMMEGVVSSKK